MAIGEGQRIQIRGLDHLGIENTAIEQTVLITGGAQRCQRLEQYHAGVGGGNADIEVEGNRVVTGKGGYRHHMSGQRLMGILGDGGIDQLDCCNCPLSLIG